MLNCFFWYSAIWMFILLLYSCNISSYNTPLNSGLLCFILITSAISLLLGIFFRKKFIFQEDSSVEITSKPLYALLLGYLADFFYAKNIPFLSIVFFKTSSYGEFEGIPLFHVLLIGFSSYYALKYFYCFLCTSKNRKKNFLSYLTILFLFFLGYYRSMIVFNVIMALLMTLAKLRARKKIYFKHYLVAFALIVLLCYGYGGIGNVRDGYKWNDNTYIERLGLYTNFPSFIPKQYMWTYSYLTTPLANLNYNITKQEPDYDKKGLLYEFFPSAISKRVFPEVKEDNFILIKTYFNAVTGWCNVYLHYGYIGMYLLFFFMVALTLIGIYFLSFPKNQKKRTMFSVVLCVIYVFMFFYNTLNFVGLSLLFWLSFLPLFPRLILKKEKIS